MEVPAVRYARNQGVSLAYQIWGDGPAVVGVPPAAQNIELAWERPEYRAVYERLGRFSRHLHFDKRGTGASDRTVAVPTLDERVEDLAAIMDDAGLEHAYLIGSSEGGPVAVAFAATYPARVDGVVLLCTAARLVGDLTPEELTARHVLIETVADRWGTDQTLSLDVWAPSFAADPTYRAWEPRYERQAASPAALRELFQMVAETDVRPLLGLVEVPTVVIHRAHDPVLSLAQVEETVAGLPNGRLVVVDGHDHWAHAGDMHAWMDEIERFITGAVKARPQTANADRPAVTVHTMGGFAVRVGGEELPLTTWGSRRARQLCKRIAVAAGEPVRRDELYEQLWPDETDRGRLSARLSVLLSNVRRVLGGGVVADRDAVRLDLNAIQLDLRDVLQHAAAGRDEAVIAAYHGPLLPEDAYEDWAIEARDRLSRVVIGARRRLAAQASASHRHDTVSQHATAILDLDPFDEQAHELLVLSLLANARHADAVRADERYRSHMAELGVRPRDLLGGLDRTITSGADPGRPGHSR